MDDTPWDDESHRDRNRDHWNQLAGIHPETDHYDVDGFLAGESSLREIERGELADVVGPGTELLHLQCHFGLDTLSWARTGASVVGVDFSGEAVDRARRLAERAGLADRAEFVECDVYDLAEHVERSFDVVFASYGVIYWLPDLPRWAQLAADRLRPGGTFYLVEGHPLGTAVSGVDGRAVTLDWPYWGGRQPVAVEGSYADPEADVVGDVVHEWPHSLGEVVSAVADAGLVVEHLHEFPVSEFRAFEGLERDSDGWYRLPDGPDLPLLFSLRARKPS